MTSPEQLPTSAQTARRQLVRGVFAAPALLTVFSGGALAAGSAKRCLVNQTNTPTMLPVTGHTDNYLRVELRQTGSSPNFIYWVRGSDIQTWKKPSTTVHLNSTQWQPFNITTNTAGAVQGSEPSNHSASSKFAALRFDANGNLKGVGISTAANQSAIAGTCWQSVALTL
jgi:hypothetical protein